MHGLILASLGNDWTLAGSIMTFALPVGLFIVMASILYFMYTRPHIVPGHRELTAAGARASAAPSAPEAGPAAGGTEGGTEGSQ